MYFTLGLLIWCEEQALMIYEVPLAEADGA